MARLAIALVVVLACACFASAQKSGGDEWDFFVLAQQWPGGYQSTNWPACTSTFTLHGLWPTRNDSTWPQDCSSKPFDENALGSSLISTMNCVWPSSTGDAKTFWAHEWTTHGTCAFSDPSTATEKSFFSTAVSLHTQANIYKTLTAAGITPSYDKEVTISAISKAIQGSLSVTPVIACASSRLVTLQVCVSKALQFIECPDAMHALTSSSCGTSTWFNPIKH
jgi:ribonuclease T2